MVIVSNMIGRFGAMRTGARWNKTTLVLLSFLYGLLFGFSTFKVVLFHNLRQLPPLQLKNSNYSRVSSSGATSFTRSTTTITNSTTTVVLEPGFHITRDKQTKKGTNLRLVELHSLVIPSYYFPHQHFFQRTLRLHTEGLEQYATVLKYNQLKKEA